MKKFMANSQKGIANNTEMGVFITHFEKILSKRERFKALLTMSLLPFWEIILYSASLLSGKNTVLGEFSQKEGI